MFKGEICFWIYLDIMDDNVYMEFSDSVFVFGYLDRVFGNGSMKFGEIQLWKFFYIFDFSDLFFGE